MYDQVLAAIGKFRTGGVIVLSGPSGCGKTRALQRLREEGYDIEILSIEKLLDVVVDAARSNEKDALTRLRFGSSKIIAVEDVDLSLPGRKYTLDEVFRMINRKAFDENGIVILTGIDLKNRFPALFEKLDRFWDFAEVISLDEECI